MSPVKEQVLNMVRDLPEDVTLDDIMAEIYFKAQVDDGLKELDEGKGIPHEDVEKRMSRWLVVGKGSSQVIELSTALSETRSRSRPSVMALDS